MGGDYLLDIILFKGVMLQMSLDIYLYMS